MDKKDRNELIPMSELVPLALQKFGLKGELEEHQVFQAWAELGKRLVGQSWPRYFRKGRLTVEVESSPLLMECVMMKEELLAGLNLALGGGKVEKLIFKIHAAQARNFSTQRSPASPGLRQVGRRTQRDKSP